MTGFFLRDSKGTNIVDGVLHRIARCSVFVSSSEYEYQKAIMNSAYRPSIGNSTLVFPSLSLKRGATNAYVERSVFGSSKRLGLYYMPNNDVKLNLFSRESSRYHFTGVGPRLEVKSTPQFSSHKENMGMNIKRILSADFTTISGGVLGKLRDGEAVMPLTGHNRLVAINHSGGGSIYNYYYGVFTRDQTDNLSVKFLHFAQESTTNTVPVPTLPNRILVAIVEDIDCPDFAN